MLRHSSPGRPTGWLLTGALCALLLAPTAAQAQTAAVLYQRAQAKEATARKQLSAANFRAAAAAFELVVLRHPRSGYCDDALWHGAQMTRASWERYGNPRDLETTERLLRWLRREYPSSSWARQVPAELATLNTRPPAADSKAADAPAPRAAAPPAAAPGNTSAGATPGALATLRSVSVLPLPKGDRVILELDREVYYDSERIAGPDRVFFDLKAADYPAAVQAAAEALAGTRVRGIRLGRQEGAAARVVLELAGTPTASVFLMYQPYRLVVDVESDTVPPPATPPPSPVTAPTTAVPTAGPLPSPPPASTTTGGDYTLARQLGLGVSRIVIDPGHGGHDPGAKANGLVEANLVLDIALRVEALLKKHPGVDVVLTRRTNEFIPLEERTAIAIREGADLFLSIHANAARRTTARGVETYVLNFATNPEAEAVAARENATSATSIGKLPKLVQQITLNTKVKESREFAQMVQTAMIRGLRTQNKAVQDRGVKQAPFVVLIGADMPSVLTEISFLTNRAEALLLKKDAYKQEIAQSLADAILRYQASLKKITTH
jgi:N-acetylmuramoyl-L-alanine amidase